MTLKRLGKGKVNIRGGYFCGLFLFSFETFLLTQVLGEVAGFSPNLRMSKTWRSWTWNFTILSLTCLNCWKGNKKHGMKNHLAISGDILDIGLGCGALGFLEGHLSGQYPGSFCSCLQWILHLCSSFDPLPSYQGQLALLTFSIPLSCYFLASN